MTLAKTLLDTFFPNRCLACSRGTRGHFFCPDCRTALEPISALSCRSCGLPLPLREPGSICLSCVARPPPFDSLGSAYLYGGPLRDALLSLKHGKRFEKAGRLGAMMAEKLAGRVPPGLAAVVPVPLYRKRLVDREYNQALLLAREIAWRLCVPLRPGLMRRIRNTGSQKGLSGRRRAANLKGAFAAVSAGEISGSSILLVDDVVASGATVSECARTFKKAGVIAVHVWCLARSSA